MIGADDFKRHWVGLLATLQHEAGTRFESELDESRTLEGAGDAETLGRLRDTRWVPFDAVSRLVDEISAAAALERARAIGLAADLEACRRDVDAARAQRQAAITAVHEASFRDWKEAVALFTHELNTARELAQSAAAAEAQVREELVAVRISSQEILDAQMLELLELKRRLHEASADADRARAEAAAARREVATRPAERTTSAPKLPPRAERSRNERAPGFAAIEAVLAGSPPVRAWQHLDA